VFFIISYIGLRDVYAYSIWFEIKYGYSNKNVVTSQAAKAPLLTASSDIGKVLLSLGSNKPSVKHDIC
jgi:hypothetical protein